MPRRLVLPVAVAALLALPAGAAGLVLSADVDVVGLAYTPPEQRLPANGQVRWNYPAGSGPSHTVTAFDGSFDSGAFAATDADPVYDRLFDAEGRFEYFCKVHGAAMSGAINVNDATYGGEAWPVLDAEAGYAPRTSAATTTGAAAIVVAPALTLDEADGEDVASATVTGAAAGDTLAVTNPGPLGVTVAADGRSLTITGAAQDAVYQAALRTVTLKPGPTAGARRIVFRATDLGVSEVSAAKGNPDFRDVAVTAAAPPAGPGTAPPPQPVLPSPSITPVTPARLSGLPRTVRLDRRGRIRLRFLTDPGARGTLVLRTRGELVIARVRFRATSAGRADVRVRLGPVRRRRIARTGSLRALVRVVTATSVSDTRTLTIRRPRR